MPCSRKAQSPRPSALSSQHHIPDTTTMVKEKGDGTTRTEEHVTRDSRRTNHDSEAGGPGDLFTENPRWDNSAEQTKFTLSPSQLLLVSLRV